MKRSTLLIAMLLLPVAAGAQTFTASLDGDAGTGFANIIVNGDLVDYSIVTSGLDPAPSSAVITDGVDTIDLEATFAGAGAAIGSATSTSAGDVVANPGAYSVVVSNGTDTLSGGLSSSMTAADDLIFPVVATVTGFAGTLFKTDVRLVNRSGASAMVELAYYPDGETGNDSPAVTVDYEIAANEQLMLDDIVANVFMRTDEIGAVRVSTDRPLSGFARIYNDQVDAGDGTLGQFVAGASMDDAYRSGLLGMLSNQPAATAAGFRTNIGWFNPTNSCTVTFTAYAADGAVLGSAERSVAALAQEQIPVTDLWSGLDAGDDFYVTFTTTGPELFVYASVVDNVNGDAVYIAAVED